MKFILVLFLIFPATFCASVEDRAQSGELRVGAFNVQIFGVSKMSEPEVVADLVEICSQYDIIMIQEIRDASEESFPQLVNDVNAKSSYEYAYVIGPREGRSSSKEQYGFMYRTAKVHVISQWLYDDSGDLFEREPYVVQFERVSGTPGTVRSFSYVPLHAKPSDAVSELNAMDLVYNEVVSRNGEEALLMGDFNADCSYVTSSEFSEISIWTDTDTYTWMIPNSADTTVSSTDCAYDRVVKAGSIVTENVYTADVYRFDTDMNLNYEQTYDVSDHYPVDVYIP